jgi:histidine ammonia-lyase
VIALDGGKLTAADIVAIAHREASVEVTPEARARVAASHEFAARVAAERPIYATADRDLTADIDVATTLIGSLAKLA